MDCNQKFLGIKPWYEGLAKPPDCDIQIDSLNAIWIIVLNIAEILLRLSAYVAVGFIIYGAVLFVISQGSPDKIAAAKSTIQNAVIGLILSVLATLIVSYIAGLF